MYWNWILRLAGPHGINRLRFGAITADIAYDRKSTVTVRATPFTLIINGAKLDVKQGGNQIANVA